jgi:ABC-2 type transport system ATP-binding protein
MGMTAHDDERFGMPEGQVLEFSGITKRFGAVTAVSDFSARVEPGRVTGFLGPNGAGKTTTLRILLGLVRASDGTATIGGKPYASLTQPLQTVGAVLEASSFHPGRSAANHLKVYAQAAGIPLSRVDETLGLVGLADVGGRKVGGFSLGMRQRLGLAYALLGDPGVLVLDEPANGLDPEGIKWMRGFLRRLAREGRTVFVSSHLLAEVQQTVDSVLIIAQGRLVFEGALEDLADPSESATVVDSPDRAGLSAALAAAGVPFEMLRTGLTVRGLDPVAVGAVAASAGVALSSLQRRGPALEEVFLDLVSGVRVHQPAVADTPPAATVAVAAGSEPQAEDVAVTATPEPAPDAAHDMAADADGEASAQTPAVASVRDAAGAPAAALAASAAAAAAVWTTADAVEPDDESDAEPPVEATVDPTPGPMYAVASTGVIDIIAFDAGDPATDADQDGLPLDADPDVEALGAIDEELTDDEAAPQPDPVGGPVSSDRPWETYVKTDADVEADAFFASFTAAERAEALAAEAAGAAAASAPDPTSGPASAADTDAASGPASGPASAADTDAASDPEPESEPEPAPEAASDEGPALDDTSELGTLADLSPDWVEDDVDARDDDGPDWVEDDADVRDEEGEQR